MRHGSSSRTPSTPESQCRGCRCLQAIFAPWRRTDPRTMKATATSALTTRSTSSPSRRGAEDGGAENRDWLWRRQAMLGFGALSIWGRLTAIRSPDWIITQCEQGHDGHSTSLNRLDSG
jgi:hypothetical protein